MNLTREQIEQMPPGAELDDLVHLLVFGYKPLAHVTPQYSTDMSDAWLIVELPGVACDLEKENRPEGVVYQCSYWPNGVRLTQGWASGPTAPVAICRAALLATLPMPITSEE